MAAAVAAAVIAPVLLAALGAAPLDDPGEGMHAEIARELRLSGDPVRLTLNGVRYVDKPPLLYVLLAAVFAVAGPGEAAARLVAAAAALVAVAATAWLGARLLGAPYGLVAGLALATSAGFFAYGRYVRPETLFVAALAIGFALLLSGVADGRRGLSVLGLAAFGLAALAKDPLGALLPPVAVALAMAMAGRARPLARWLPWPGVAAVLVLGLGWYAAAAVATPGFVWYTVVDNHVLNVARARRFPDEDVPLSALEFLAVAGAGAAPWIVAAAVAVWGLLRRRAWRDPHEAPWVALALWAVGVLAVTALSGFRLPHYGLPAYPALGLLAARAWRDAPARPLVVVHAVLLGGLATACAVAWLGAGAPLSGLLDATDVATRKGGGALDVRPFVPLLGLTALVLGAAAAVLGALGARGGPRLTAAYVVAAVMLLVMPSVSAGLAAVASARSVRGIALEIARRASPGDVVAHEGPIENSGALEWYGAPRPVIVDGRRSVLGFGATAADAAGVFWDAGRLRHAWSGPARVWLVSGRAPDSSVATGLPNARLVAERGGRRLYVNR